MPEILFGFEEIAIDYPIHFYAYKISYNNVNNLFTCVE